MAKTIRQKTVRVITWERSLNLNRIDDDYNKKMREKALVKKKMIFTSASCLTEWRSAFMIVFKPG